VHQHRRSVALFISQLAMRNGGLGKDSTAVLRGSSTGPAKADHQIFNQLWEVSSALLVAEMDSAQVSRPLSLSPAAE